MTCFDFPSKYLLIMELRFEAMVYSNYNLIKFALIRPSTLNHKRNL